MPARGQCGQYVFPCPREYASNYEDRKKLKVFKPSDIPKSEMAKIFKQAFLNNNYFSHSELVILALLADKDQEKRRLGVNLILEAREEYTYDPANLRKFRKPKEKDINFDASDYSNLLNYETFEGKSKSFSKSFIIFK